MQLREEEEVVKEEEKKLATVRALNGTEDAQSSLWPVRSPSRSTK